MVRLVWLASAMASTAVGNLILGQGRESFSKEEYVSGEVHMSLRERKLESWKKAEEAGVFASAQYPELGYTKCVNGRAVAGPGGAANTFRCQNMDLHHFLSHDTLGDTRGEGSSSWGWTNTDGREFVAIGQFGGTAFVEINRDGKMLYLGRLPAYSVGSEWREIRSYKNYMVIGSEAQNHGIQIFDMRKLLNINPASPRQFTQADLTSWTRTLLPTGRAHNVVINEEKQYFAAVGALPRTDVCRSGFAFFDMTNPASPRSLGCAAGDGYVHDAECLVYRGPDTRYTGRDICYSYNEDTLTIMDVGNKANVTNIISKVTYPGARYVHQGSVLDRNNQQFIVMDDEIDELERTGVSANGFATTYIVDIRDLRNPKITGNYQMRHRAIDHNQYVIDGYSYQSSYGAGVRVFDVRSIPSDPTGKSVCEAGFFDIYPEDDNQAGGGQIEFLGTWSSYAYFKSGYIFVNTIERGAFVVKMTSKTCA
ncbi:hypothetical protein CB0940_08458 [Cercospora beticola]|uniref:Regulatory P domain-containing protein n=2 Tax=Cercospora beticola TaxID=122368 RepID=A0A2G5HPF2_CERBT|nr:hypothetical protein CB0940_08458 [Cercospora beticola]PIA94414.1 hypothetical protein CB0940_08458 [Cercospora beticola]